MDRGVLRAGRGSAAAAFVTALCLVAVCGCGGPLAAKAAWRILMTIGAEVVISEGVDHVKRLIGGDGGGGGEGPIVRVQHGDAEGDIVTVAYRVEGTTGVSVSVVKGTKGEVGLSVDGDGNVRITVKPRTSAVISLDRSATTVVNGEARVPDDREPSTQAPPSEPPSESPEPSSESPEPVNESPSPEPEPPASVGLVGTWQGSYVCAQGLTGLRLTIEAGPSPGEVRALFSFFPLSTNPGVPRGSYYMRGAYTSGWLRLEGYQWIQRPYGYVMVGLVAQVDPGDDHIHGSVNNASCGDFSLERL